MLKKSVVIIVAAIDTVAIVAIVVIIAANKAAMVTMASLMNSLLPAKPKAVDFIGAKGYCIMIGDVIIATGVIVIAIITMD